MPPGRTAHHGNRAVFVDGSGRRAVVGRVLGVGVGVVLVAYLVAFGLSLLGVSWVPPVDLPVVGDVLPTADADSSTGSSATERTTRSLAVDESNRRDDAPDLPSSPVPASLPAVDVAVSDDVPAPDPVPTGAGRLSAATATTAATTLGIAAVPAPPTDPGPVASPGTAAATAPRSPPTSLPSQPATATPAVSHAGGNAPDQPPGAPSDTPSATAPGRP